MALLINQEIVLSNNEILSNFYLRIEYFNIDKISGTVKCVSTPYPNSENALLNSCGYSIKNTLGPGKITTSEFYYDLSRTVQNPIIWNSTEMNLPREHEFSITKFVQIPQDIYDTVQSEEIVPYYDFDAEGNVIELTRTVTVTQQIKTGTTILDRNEIDLSLLGTNPYNWIYSQLKKEYEKIFGLGNVLDA
jgi:hypothetical protein